MKLFNFDIHLGKWRVLVQTRDINDKAITGRKIADRAIDWYHILAGAIRNEHIADKTVNTRTLADDAVSTRNIQNKAVTPYKLHPSVIPFIIKPFINKYDHEICKLKAKDVDLQNQIDSFNEKGVSVSNVFGTDQHVSVSQKTLTDAFNMLWQKLEDMTGEMLQGIIMLVTPDYFISEDGATVHVSANTAETNGIFEEIAFYGNGALIAKYENTEYIEFDHHIEETTVIMCKAKIMGIEYTRQHIITHYNSFWLGAGNSYEDIMDVEHVIPITNGLRGGHDVSVGEDQHIIIILGDTLRGGFDRADISFAEIKFTETTVTIDGNDYIVLTSEDTYQEGTYRVFING